MHETFNEGVSHPPSHEQSSASVETRKQTCRDFMDVAERHFFAGDAPLQRLLNRVKGTAPDGSDLSAALLSAVQSGYAELLEKHRMSLGLAERDVDEIADA